MFAILTTKTIHHNFFVKEIIKRFQKTIVIYEKKIIKPKYKTFHKFEKQRDSYEKNVWFKNKNQNLPKKQVFLVNDINDISVLKILKKNNCKYLISFGTKKIQSSFIKNYKNCIFNLHGGNPEKYRGLDSHYWAIYHKDFSSLSTTLHLLREKLDTGDIIFKKKIKFNKFDSILTLRKKNTELCIELTINLFNILTRNKKYKKYKQKQIGKYYSFIPKVLKDIVKINFEKYINERF